MARRERRRRGTQYTGILRSDRPRTTEDRPAPQHSVGRGMRVRWRFVSLIIIVCMLGMLALFFMTDVFYVRSIAVSGAQYMTREEIFTYADITGMHIFWVKPDEVRENLMRYPTVADASVRLAWPPQMVNISLEERQPALVWEQDGTEVWVDIQGNAIEKREERPELVRIQVDDPAIEGPLGESARLSTDVVFGVLQLHELRPEIGVWQYDAVHGLGYIDENGWNVWFGTGTDMPEKIQIYEAVASYIISQNITVGEISVEDPDVPYLDLQGR